MLITKVIVDGVELKFIMLRGVSNVFAASFM